MSNHNRNRKEKRNNKRRKDKSATLATYPLQQLLASRVTLLHLDLEAQNDDPDQTEDQLQVAVDNVSTVNAHQLNAFT
jgi:hypothetical protein